MELDACGRYMDFQILQVPVTTSLHNNKLLDAVGLDDDATDKSSLITSI
jgi:hypothetical protein